MPSVTKPDDAASTGADETPEAVGDPRLEQHPEQQPGPPPSAAARRHGLGGGLIAGLATTARAMVRHTHTAEYPDVKPDLPPRSRGVIALQQENCTSCMLCARECPDWCIYIESHKEEVPAAEPGGRARQKNMLDRFAIDFSLCMYCGICIEVCPFDALYWSPEFEYAEFDIRNLLHESDRLQGWMASVPPPPPADPRAPEAKEVTVARAAADKAISAYEAMLADQRPVIEDDENLDDQG
jgi:NADH-quinone oxidoreductase subunit I